RSIAQTDARAWAKPREVRSKPAQCSRAGPCEPLIQFQKRCQFFICAHYETSRRRDVREQSRFVRPLESIADTPAPTETDFAEIVSDDFAIFHSSDRSQSSIYIWENLKYSIKPRSLENRAHGFVQTSQEKLATICFNVFHG